MKNWSCRSCSAIPVNPLFTSCRWIPPVGPRAVLGFVKSTCANIVNEIRCSCTNLCACLSVNHSGSSTGKSTAHAPDPVPVHLGGQKQNETKDQHGQRDLHKTSRYCHWDIATGTCNMRQPAAKHRTWSVRLKWLSTNKVTMPRRSMCCPSSGTFARTSAQSTMPLASCCSTARTTTKLACC